MTDTATLHYDGAPRPITEEEAKTIAHAEYVRGFDFLAAFYVPELD